MTNHRPPSQRLRAVPPRTLTASAGQSPLRTSNSRRAKLAKNKAADKEAEGGKGVTTMRLADVTEVRKAKSGLNRNLLEVVGADGSTLMFAVKWDQSARAGHYRVWKKVVGVDENFISVGSPSDLDFTIENLPAGKTIQIAVSAVNNGGESLKSEVVTIVTA